MIRSVSAVMALLMAAVIVSVAAPGIAQAAASCNSFTTYGSETAHVRVPSIGWDSGVIECELGRGNIGDAVRVLQVSMRSCYGQNIADDREFGPKTQQALRNVQNLLGVPSDGRYGPQTRRAGFLFAAYPTFETWNPTPGACYRLLA
ncbi:peptidoglycan-binding domain-containing protein [Amycolatopsis sp. A133]|uniref:peptidoglycan-binding domain-containing protein n=1 Tax=Amycolatopsis sp. A133 TaxID=3064472 RepID=UPI0027F330EA|nr:peptidoglycan-binding domain-containing protein [Amycolatopsis sp. A133]MDQ7808646.1 peptidoglycan-binding domain-containing protein [Amycolatopsis sp. A133]